MTAVERDYLEARLDTIQVMFDAHEEALARARGHIEAIFDEHRKAHTQKHTDDERAVDQARQAVNLRLEKLNELRAEVIQDRGEFVRHDVFDAAIAPLREFRSRALGAGALVALGSGVI